MAYKKMSILWKDHWTQSGWRKIDELDTKPVDIESIGYVVYEDDKVYIISSSVTEDSRDCNGVLGILKNTVIKTKRIP